MALHEDGGAINTCGCDGIHRLRKGGTVQCLVPCVVNGSKADVNEWLKGGTAFGRAKDHSVKEVAESRGIHQIWPNCAIL